MELLNNLDYCGHLCAATGRCAEALTLWATYAALLRHERMQIHPRTRAADPNRCARPGRRSGPRGRGQLRNAARR